MNLRKAAQWGEVPTTTEAQYLPVTLRGSEDKGATKQRATLPGEDPLILGRCNYDTLSPKRYSNVSVMGQGVADEALVVVKRLADEDKVTYLRIKLSGNNKEAEAKGGTH